MFSYLNGLCDHNNLNSLKKLDYQPYQKKIQYVCKKCGVMVLKQRDEYSDQSNNAGDFKDLNNDKTLNKTYKNNVYYTCDHNNPNTLELLQGADTGDQWSVGFRSLSQRKSDKVKYRCKVCGLIIIRDKDFRGRLDGGPNHIVNFFGKDMMVNRC